MAADRFLSHAELDAGEMVSGERVVRIESVGPTPIEFIQSLCIAPPSQIANCDVVTVAVHEQDTAVDFHFVDGRASVAAQPERAVTLAGEFWVVEDTTHAHDAASARSSLVAVLDALTEMVGDPERAETALHLGSLLHDRALDYRARELFDQAPRKLSSDEALALVIRSMDLTTLAGDDTAGRVRALCARARQPDVTDPAVGPTAAVCVYPNLVGLAVELTADSLVAVASVAGAFPSGLSSLEVRLSDIAEAVAAGAQEIDVVLNRAALLAGDHTTVFDELRAMRLQIGSRAMKVILEVSELQTAGAISTAAQLSMAAGADWIKTSTGKSRSGATPFAVLVMAGAIAEYEQRTGRAVGLKVSGGVRTSADALGYLAIVEHTLGEAWLRPTRVRFGASGLLNAVVADLAARRSTRERG